MGEVYRAIDTNLGRQVALDGQTALSMELVEGPTLADRISGGPGC